VDSPAQKSDWGTHVLVLGNGPPVPVMVRRPDLLTAVYIESKIHIYRRNSGACHSYIDSVGY
jgi:hypothetical protein